MVFGLFKKNCPICGKNIEKEMAAIRFGKYFCSEEHTQEYRQKLAKEQSKIASKGGCCR